jgi:hypothetical protein
VPWKEKLQCEIRCRWFKEFEKYVDGDEAEDGTVASRPGKIQNHDIIDGGEQVEKDIDFPVGPDWQYDLKRSMYGTTLPGHMNFYFEPCCGLCPLCATLLRFCGV